MKLGTGRLPIILALAAVVVVLFFLLSMVIETGGTSTQPAIPGRGVSSSRTGDVAAAPRALRARPLRHGQGETPIPLTKEMDDQLVKEGIIPPLDKGEADPGASGQGIQPAR